MAVSGPQWKNRQNIAENPLVIVLQVSERLTFPTNAIVVLTMLPQQCTACVHSTATNMTHANVSKNKQNQSLQKSKIV